MLLKITRENHQEGRGIFPLFCGEKLMDLIAKTNSFGKNMFLNSKHENLNVYRTARRFTICCYRFSRQLPPDERFTMVQQLRRAALSVHLNLAEGCSRKSPAERKRYFEVSRGSVTEIDALLDIAVDLEYFSKEQLSDLGELMISVYKMLSRMIDSTD